MPDHAPLPRRWIDALFRKFVVYYGSAWTQRFGSVGLSMDELADEWANELAGFSGDELACGVAACKTAKFPPSLPEFLAFCRPATASNRPSADEAWAIALRASDEAETVVWTEEIAQAWGVCLPVVESGDEVGARMAFRAAYERITADAKVAGVPAKWIVSQGHDADKRAIAIERARVAGLLPAPVVAQFVPLIESRREPAPSTDVAARIADLKAALSASRPPRETETDRTRRLKAEAARKIEEHAQ